MYPAIPENYNRLSCNSQIPYYIYSHAFLHVRQVMKYIEEQNVEDKDGDFRIEDK